MATARRVFWESVVVISFFAILGSVLLWSQGRAERRAAVLDRQHQEARLLEAEQQRQEIEALRRSWDEHLGDRVRREAEAVFTAFEAGAHTAIGARWGRYLSGAKDALINQSDVVFVHIVTPQGRVITSSDDELTAAGRLDERGDWALATDTLESRLGDLAGTLELAGPVVENDRPVAFLWIGYDLAAMTERAAAAD